MLSTGLWFHAPHRSSSSGERRVRRCDSGVSAALLRPYDGRRTEPLLLPAIPPTAHAAIAPATAPATALRSRAHGTQTGRLGCRRARAHRGPGDAARGASASPSGSVSAPTTVTPPPPASDALIERRALEARRDSVSLDPFEPPAERPNIVVVMTDDMRDDDLRFMPNVQRLIGDRGVRFANMFSPAAAVLPGSRVVPHRPVHAQPRCVVAPCRRTASSRFDDRATLPVWLPRPRATTPHFLGKYLNGYGSQRRCRTAELRLRYVPPGWTDWRGVGRGPRRVGLEEHLTAAPTATSTSTLNVDGVLEPHQGVYQTHLLQPDRPAAVPHAGPVAAAVLLLRLVHRPTRGPRPSSPTTRRRSGWPTGRCRSSRARRDRRTPGAASTSRSPGSPAPTMPRTTCRGSRSSCARAARPATDEVEGLLEDYRQRVESFSVVDDEVANMMATLERTGELDDTYVVFTSDNGFFVGRAPTAARQGAAVRGVVAGAADDPRPGHPARRDPHRPVRDDRLRPDARRGRGRTPVPAIVDGVSCSTSPERRPGLDPRRAHRYRAARESRGRRRRSRARTSWSPAPSRSGCGSPRRPDRPLPVRGAREPASGSSTTCVPTRGSSPTSSTNPGCGRVVRLLAARAGPARNCASGLCRGRSPGAAHADAGPGVRRRPLARPGRP